MSDMGTGVIRRIRSDGSTEVFAEPGGGPNGTARGPAGALYVANNGGIAWHNGHLDLLAPPPSHARIERVDPDGTVTEIYRTVGDRPLRKASDIAIDRAGVIWFTDPGHDPLTAPTGHVVRAESDGSSIDIVATGCAHPNGLAFTSDESLLMVAETGAAAVYAYDVVAGRHLVDRREFARMPDNYRPDGLCFDDEGNLLVAGAFGGGVLVFDHTGELTDTIPLDDPLTTNVAFGGEGGDDLFITQARTGTVLRLKWRCRGAKLPFEP